ncbi:hypothetical protein IH980_02825 [Patescibacteria group bacterium]|nr:hypothetical protein [Patescibacteria group bacterium]
MNEQLRDTPEQLPFEDQPPISRTISRRMVEIGAELEQRHGPEYSAVDFIIRSPGLAAENTALILGLVCIAGPEAAVHSLINALDQAEELLSHLHEEGGRE